MKFTQHYSGSAVCAPTRAILLTGKNSGYSYVRDNFEKKNKRKNGLTIFTGQYPATKRYNYNPFYTKKNWL